MRFLKEAEGTEVMLVLVMESQWRSRPWKLRGEMYSRYGQ